ncbi:MAG: AAA family ATPase [Lachnospiraceae bacterium]|nr:AAA family ATPase [Lachnospiraceae bacterium]
MLESLRVKNLALIEEAEVDFKEGLNVLTGETGAGKSILIGSVNLALGAKADKDLIRSGKEFAYVELVFYTKDEKVLNKAKEMDIFPEEDRFIISRKISQTKSISKINGETVTVKQIKELAELLLDIHGQHEHQSLLKESKQKEILDTFCEEKLVDLKQELKRVYK